MEYILQSQVTMQVTETGTGQADHVIYACKEVEGGGVL